MQQVIDAPISSRTITRSSFWFVALFIITLGFFKLSTPFITVLFSTIALQRLRLVTRKWVAVTILVVAVSIIIYFLAHFLTEAWRAFPEVAGRSIPMLADFAAQIGVVLPFTDPKGLHDFVLQALHGEFLSVAHVLELTGRVLVYIVIGIVVACSIFFSERLDLGGHPRPDNLYSAFADQLTIRFVRFYESFRTVMGAQLVISFINTFFTGLFLITLRFFDFSLPHPMVLIIITFLCGILPIVGNLISNAIIFAVAITHSITLAVIALGYLIVLHKFEYFLNSKIIGGRIKNPMWLTLLGLLAGEQLMGVPGMILAPVILHYIRVESGMVAAETRAERSECSETL